jgi:uncharacterized protein YxjI
MFCSFCGHKNTPTSNFCMDCGNNLKQNQQSFKNKNEFSEPVKYNKADFKVKQRLFAFTATYNVSDIKDQEVMTVKREFSSFFSPKLVATDTNGNLLGIVQGNFFKTKWEIFNDKQEVLGILHFPFFMFITKSFTLETPIGVFRSGNSVFAKRFDAYDPNGNLSFTVDKKIMSIRDTFLIQSNGLLNPLLTCLAAICIDQRFHQGNN